MENSEQDNKTTLAEINEKWQPKLLQLCDDNNIAFFKNELIDEYKIDCQVAFERLQKFVSLIEQFKDLPNSFVNQVINKIWDTFFYKEYLSDVRNINIKFVKLFLNKPESFETYSHALALLKEYSQIMRLNIDDENSMLFVLSLVGNIELIDQYLIPRSKDLSINLQRMKIGLTQCNDIIMQKWIDVTHFSYSHANQISKPYSKSYKDFLISFIKDCANNNEQVLLQRLLRVPYKGQTSNEWLIDDPLLNSLFEEMQQFNSTQMKIFITAALFTSRLTPTFGFLKNYIWFCTLDDKYDPEIISLLVNHNAAPDDCIPKLLQEFTKENNIEALKLLLTHENIAPLAQYYIEDFVLQTALQSEKNIDILRWLFGMTEDTSPKEIKLQNHHIESAVKLDNLKYLYLFEAIKRKEQPGRINIINDLYPDLLITAVLYNSRDVLNDLLKERVSSSGKSLTISIDDLVKKIQTAANNSDFFEIKLLSQDEVKCLEEKLVRAVNNAYGKVIKNHYIEPFLTSVKLLYSTLPASEHPELDLRICQYFANQISRLEPGLIDDYHGYLLQLEITFRQRSNSLLPDALKQQFAIAWFNLAQKSQNENVPNHLDSYVFYLRAQEFIGSADDAVTNALQELFGKITLQYNNAGDHVEGISIVAIALQHIKRFGSGLECPVSTSELQYALDASDARNDDLSRLQTCLGNGETILSKQEVANEITLTQKIMRYFKADTLAVFNEFWNIIQYQEQHEAELIPVKTQNIIDQLNPDEKSIFELISTQETPLGLWILSNLNKEKSCTALLTSARTNHNEINKDGILTLLHYTLSHGSEGDLEKLFKMLSIAEKDAIKEHLSQNNHIVLKTLNDYERFQRICHYLYPKDDDKKQLFQTNNYLISHHLLRLMWPFNNSQLAAISKALNRDQLDIIKDYIISKAQDTNCIIDVNQLFESKWIFDTLFSTDDDKAGLIKLNNSIITKAVLLHLAKQIHDKKGAIDKELISFKNIFKQFIQQYNNLKNPAELKEIFMQNDYQLLKGLIMVCKRGKKFTLRHAIKDQERLFTTDTIGVSCKIEFITKPMLEDELVEIIYKNFLCDSNDVVKMIKQNIFPATLFYIMLTQHLKPDAYQSLFNVMDSEATHRVKDFLMKLHTYDISGYKSLTHGLVQMIENPDITVMLNEMFSLYTPKQFDSIKDKNYAIYIRLTASEDILDEDLKDMLLDIDNFIEHWDQYGSECQEKIKQRIALKNYQALTMLIDIKKTPSSDFIMMVATGKIDLRFIADKSFITDKSFIADKIINTIFTTPDEKQELYKVKQCAQRMLMMNNWDMLKALSNDNTVSNLIEHLTFAIPNIEVNPDIILQLLKLENQNITDAVLSLITPKSIREICDSLEDYPEIEPYLALIFTKYQNFRECLNLLVKSWNFIHIDSLSTEIAENTNESFKWKDAICQDKIVYLLCNKTGINRLTLHVLTLQAIFDIFTECHYVKHPLDAGATITSSGRSDGQTFKDDTLKNIRALQAQYISLINDSDDSQLADLKNSGLLTIGTFEPINSIPTRLLGSWFQSERESEAPDQIIQRAAEKGFGSMCG